MTGFLLPLDGPMQSWADTGFGQLREAGPFPSRAGVLGVVAAALGVPRADARLVALHEAFRVHVATARPGHVRRDFHTVDTRRPSPTLTWRDYHHDARFAVLVEADDAAAVAEALDALRRPVYPAFLGRRACPPAEPLLPDRHHPPTLAGLAAFADAMREARRPAHPGGAGPVVLYLDGHHAAAPEPFADAVVTHGTRRDRLVGPHRAYVNRPYTRLVASPAAPSDPHAETFDAF